MHVPISNLYMVYRCTIFTRKEKTTNTNFGRFTKLVGNGEVIKLSRHVKLA